MTLESTGGGCVAVEIAIDGFYLPSSRDIPTSGTVLLPGSTAEWLVVCNQPGRYLVNLGGIHFTVSP